MSLFSTIAPVYNLFFKAQKKAFFRDLQEYPLVTSNHNHVVDLGCGTGALAHALHAQGYSVIGVDASDKMIRYAKKNNTGTNNKFKVVDITEPLPFLDQSVDVLFISFVLHGMQPKEREIVYKEMKRVTKDRIVINEYGQDKDWIHSLAEWLERGDYFNFINVFDEELKNHYGNYTMIETNKIGKWYLIDCKK